MIHLSDPTRAYVPNVHQVCVSSTIHGHWDETSWVWKKKGHETLYASFGERIS